MRKGSDRYEEVIKNLIGNCRLNSPEIILGSFFVGICDVAYFRKEKEMGFFDEVLKYASMGVMAWGAVLAVVGIINFSEGHSQQNAARKEEGMGKIIGGGVIFIVGMTLVPQISSLLSI